MMGDQLNKHDDVYARDRFFGRTTYLELDDNSLPWILDHIDCFNRQARLNESIKVVLLYGYSGDDQDDEVWDKFGQAIGNLQALDKLRICTNYDENGDLSTSAWEIMGRILRHVRQKIDVDITDIDNWDGERSRLLAQAIHGHPTLQVLRLVNTSPTDPWMSCIRHWQHCPLWNRLAFVDINHKQR
jgi:hypothetical protein